MVSDNRGYARCSSWESGADGYEAHDGRIACPSIETIHKRLAAQAFATESKHAAMTSMTENNSLHCTGQTY